MKLDSVILHHLRMPLVAPFETSFGRIDQRDCILIEINMNGLTGWGECVADRDPGYAYETTGTAWHLLSDFILPVLLAAEISKPSDIIPLLTHIRGHPMAKAGVEMALWDLYGKQVEQPLSNLIGGIRSEVSVGVSVGIQKNVHKLLEVIESYLSAGYRRIKIKIKPGRDLKEVRAVRAAYPDLMLQVDANSAYTLETSPVFEEIDRASLLLIEQPLAEDDLWDHHLLQQKLNTPICLDESILSERHARQAIEMDACRIINIKSGRVGGITESVRIHNLCQQNRIPVWCGGMLESGVGRAANLALASLPGFLLPGDISATDRYYDEDIVEEKFLLNEGSTISVPQNPGLGIEVNSKAVKKFSLATKRFLKG